MKKNKIAKEILKKKFLLIEDDMTVEAHTHLVVEAMDEYAGIKVKEALESKWIDVTKKKKPKTLSKWDSVPVIIARDFDAMKVVGCFYSRKTGFHTDEGLQYDNVTHWMPVPEAPHMGKVINKNPSIEDIKKIYHQ